MEMKQIYGIVNDITTEILGDSAMLNEDLSNIVDVGTAILNANSMDNFVRSLVDHIGKMVFVNRKYSGSVPSVLMDGWEYGAVLEKVSCDKLPDATENESWELQDGASYDPNIFYKPSVSAKFYNKRTTFEIPQSITERQARGSFSNAEQMNAFTSMLDTWVNNSATVKFSELIMRTINNMIGETFYDYNSGGTYSGAGNTRAVNLLYAYNTQFSQSLTAAAAIYNKDFIRFAAYIMGLWKKRLTRISTLFNIGGTPRFTPDDRLHFVTLAEFDSAAAVYLQSDTYHDEMVRLPASESVPYWQASGTGYGFSDTSALNIKTVSGHTVTPSGILGVMFDRDALGVANIDRRVTSNYSPKAEFFNMWHKFDAGYFNDTNENFVVFYVA